MSPTQLSLQRLRGAGYTVAIVEHWIAQAHRRHDLFGFADIMALNSNETILLQVTTASNLASRRAKVLASPTARLWLLAGRGRHRLGIWAWSVKTHRPPRRTDDGDQRRKRSARQVRMVWLQLGDFPGGNVPLPEWEMNPWTENADVVA